MRDKQLRKEHDTNRDTDQFVSNLIKTSTIGCFVKYQLHSLYKSTNE